MDVFVVQGGHPLSGTVSVSGSKNASLPMMAATLLSKGKSTLNNVPDLVDVRTLSALLRCLGCEVTREPSSALSIQVIDEEHSKAEYDLVRRMRASVCVLGPLLARRGSARVSLPGGCNIGHRPIDIHLRGFEALGATVTIEKGDIVVRSSRLVGNEIDLNGPNGSTVLGTCNLMSAAVLAEGNTVLHSAAREPEIIALGDYLNAMGAQVSGHGTSTIQIEGVDELHGAEANVIPDRIEAATLIIAAAITRSSIQIKNIETHHLNHVIQKLNGIGVVISKQDHSTIIVDATNRLLPTNLHALPYPETPTDVQAQLTALLSTIPGESVVRDSVFPDRFMHCAELNRMNASIRQQGDSAHISGVQQLHGAHVMASDLRASAALVLAALVANGESVIHRIYHLDRGYEALETKLNSLGAQIIRCSEERLLNRKNHELQIRKSA
ncbi:UDP-N-acetylglucosamine 1-carboxyvinyltransferase [Planctomicrobium sp.]|nr:UDP-N-acetylglucosamine 1-carboxyvinyltransferase [Planctomicrobium sp.]MBT5017345.1 UDP-N-acetylglucosamine 1-carboxyvinyltransferase [Planctomicrobium sp.]MDB4743893.1 UDP-N-acetylglucosamine 1-carboxyvinyltransferase [Planctomicrobium sp.]